MAFMACTRPPKCSFLLDRLRASHSIVSVSPQRWVFVRKYSSVLRIWMCSVRCAVVLPAMNNPFTYTAPGALLPSVDLAASFPTAGVSLASRE